MSIKKYKKNDVLYRYIIRTNLIRLSPDQMPTEQWEFLRRIDMENVMIEKHRDDKWEIIQDYDDIHACVEKIVKTRNWEYIEDRLDIQVDDYIEAVDRFISFDIVCYMQGNDLAWYENQILSFKGLYQIPVRLFVEKKFAEHYGIKIPPLDDGVKDYGPEFEQAEKILGGHENG